MAPERMRMISSQAIKPIILVMLALLVLAPISLSFGQSSNSPFHSNPSDAPSPQSSATYAPVGPSGYKVLIPEIKMNRIVGETKPKSPSSVSPEPVVTEPELRPETKSESPRKSQLEPTVEPAPEVHSPPTQDGFIENRTNERPIETPQKSLEESSPETVTRLPFQHSGQKPPIPATKEDIEQNVKNGIEKESHLFGPPLAPINITEALPEPTKESLANQQTTTIPKVKELSVIKDEQNANPVESLQDQGVLVPEDWVVLQARKEADQLPLEQPKPEPESAIPKVKELSVIKDEQNVNPVESLQDQGVLVPEDWVVLQARKEADQLPLEQPESEPALESTQSVNAQPSESHTKENSDTVAPNVAQPSSEETTPPATEKEAQPTKETPDVVPSAPESQIEVSPPPKEQFPSPLDPNAQKDNNLRLYLSETAPVLEELSLLMARAPSLSLVDYDPSEVNTPTMPQDLGLKLESLKRDLRILDSKVFSIIPPSKYEQFHELIRQSISHTYLACEAISNYFQDANPEDLGKVKDHLSKAKELIQLTRKQNSSS